MALYFQDLVDHDIVNTFIENNIDGSLLPFLTTEHLLELGIVQLSQRLRVKHAITKLMQDLFSAETIGKNPDALRLKNINIDTNYVSIEALTLCVKLLQDMPSPATTKEVRKLEELFRKLRADLGPVVRLANEVKPLPVPTLDPGPLKTLPTIASSIPTIGASNLSMGMASGLLTPDHELDSASTLHFQQSPGLVNRPLTNDRPESLEHGQAPKQQHAYARSNYPPSLNSPSHSNRWSTASVLSTGVGKLAEIKPGSAVRAAARPRLVETPSTETDPSTGSNGVQTVTVNHPLRSKQSSSLIGTTHSSSSQKDMQPLQTFKASSEDTGLRLLQNAIRKNNIPRENWSKYALVICYDDKERIVKLTEKPVSIFKELQEQGKNPTIMLRELVLPSNDDKGADNEGEDIPGGML